MSQNQVRNLQEKLACQNEEICNLKEQLSLRIEDMAMKDALQKKFNELQQWVEEAKIIQKRTNDEQLNIIKCQSQKLEKVELNMTSLRADNNRLNEVNICQAEQLKALKRNEQRLIADVEKLETLKISQENELFNVKVSMQCSITFNLEQNNYEHVPTR